MSPRYMVGLFGWVQLDKIPLKCSRSINSHVTLGQPYLHTFTVLRGSMSEDFLPYMMLKICPVQANEREIDGNSDWLSCRTAPYLHSTYYIQIVPLQ